MSDDDAFLAAIRVHPADAVLRLVYADWLEVRGDARHELIRVDAAMRAVPIWSDEFQRLKPARTRLRATLPPDWLAAMDYLPKHRPMFGTLPPTAAERWRLAEEFIDIWHGGLKPGDGYTEAEVADAETRLGVPLPAALREWYIKAGRRPEFRCWIHFVRLEDMRVAYGGLIVREETGPIWEYMIRLEELSLPDPPVSELGDRPTEYVVSGLILEDLFDAAINRGPTYVLHDVLEDDWTPPEWFIPTAIQGWWEATDTIITGDGMASCRTEGANQRLVAEFGDRISRLK